MIQNKPAYDAIHVFTITLAGSCVQAISSWRVTMAGLQQQVMPFGSFCTAPKQAGDTDNLVCSLQGEPFQLG